MMPVSWDRGASGETRMNTSVLLRWAAGAGFAGMLALSLAGTGAAAPVLSSTAEVKSAAATQAIDARWRRWGWRRSYFIGSAYGYGRWYRNSGCQIPGGYYRPNACW